MLKLDNVFKQYEKEYLDWLHSGYQGTNVFTQDFIANLLEQDRKVRLRRHQEEAFLRTVYSYEIMGRKNLLLNIVTGGGKTAIIATVIAWLRSCHNIQSFLVMVPNLIVRDRLETDFKDKSVFRKERMDKDWGITDCTSFEVMRIFNIKKAFTNDKHIDEL